MANNHVCPFCSSQCLLKATVLPISPCVPAYGGLCAAPPEAAAAGAPAAAESSRGRWGQTHLLVGEQTSLRPPRAVAVREGPFPVLPVRPSLSFPVRGRFQQGWGCCWDSPSPFLFALFFLSCENPICGGFCRGQRFLFLIFLPHDLCLFCCYFPSHSTHITSLTFSKFSESQS